jgi:hypothetical protein
LLRLLLPNMTSEAITVEGCAPAFSERACGGENIAAQCKWRVINLIINTTDFITALVSALLRARGSSCGSRQPAVPHIPNARTARSALDASGSGGGCARGRRERDALLVIWLEIYDAAKMRSAVRRRRNLRELSRPRSVSPGM